MTIKTIAACVNLVTLASLGLAIGGVFGQAPAAKPGPAPANAGGAIIQGDAGSASIQGDAGSSIVQGDAGGAIVQGPGAIAVGTPGPNQALPESLSFQPNQSSVGGGIGYVIHAIDGAPDEEAAKLIALDGQMQQKSQALLGQYAAAGDDEQKSKIKEQLTEALEQQFSVQQQLREREVAKIEARVKKLRQTIDKRNDAKRSIIDKRLDQLIREAEGLGWNAPAAGPASPSVGTNSIMPASGFAPIRELPDAPRAVIGTNSIMPASGFAPIRELPDAPRANK